MKIHLKPVDPSKVIPDPATRKPLPAEGSEVEAPLSKYWRRRIAAGDVVEVMPQLPLSVELE